MALVDGLSEYCADIPCPCYVGGALFSRATKGKLTCSGYVQNLPRKRATHDS